MARMIPPTGPQETNSRGEKTIYSLLKQGLSDDFTVIHSLPWLASGVKEIDPKFPPTGEIDFIIIHASLGVLTLEIKSGKHRIEDGKFIYVETGKAINPVLQTRKNVHGLARWLGSDPALRWRFGYGYVFPHNVFGDKVIGPGFVDTTVTPHQSLVIDRISMGASELAIRIRELMTYWKKALKNPALGAERMTRLVEVLCPTYDGTPSWASRVEYDNHYWLRLTQEQASVVHRAMDQIRMVVTGWPGTGKTVIGIEIARRLIAQGKRVLMLTFNNMLVEHLRKELGTTKMSKVASWHSFCMDAARKLGKRPELTRTWLEHGCLEDLHAAQEQELIPDLDVLLLDEAQALRPEWCAWLASQFTGKPVLAFCDETQRFAFEKERISTEDLCKVFGVDRPFPLSISLRSPRNVFDHLQRVRLPSCQMSCPREEEDDTLQERVVSDMDTAIDKVIEELMAGGIDRADIVVLSRFKLLRKSPGSERYATVSRFRGMEAPAIIIAHADDMDEVDLFCSYSRATTVCIALYDAEPMGCNSSLGKFQKLVLEDPENSSLAYEAMERVQTRSILGKYVEKESLGLTSVDMSWCEDWKCWLVDRQDDTEEAALWIDYLLTYHGWPVYSWTSSTRSKIERQDPVADVGGNGPARTTYLLGWCDKCSVPTPHDLVDKMYMCQRCLDELGKLPAPSQAFRSELKKFDAIISSDKPAKLRKEEIDGLPLPLAALGARKFVRARSQDVPDKLNLLPDSSILRRWSTAFIYSRISVKPIGEKIELVILNKETGRYVFPTGLMLKAWSDAISRSLGYTETAGLLEKVTKGVYKTVSISNDAKHS